MVVIGLPGCIYYVNYEPRGEKLAGKELGEVAEVSDASALLSVREKYKAEFARLSPGMTVEQFRQVFTDAAFVEQRGVSGGTVQAYSLILRQRYRYKGSAYAFWNVDEVWFYFVNGAFTKWGAAGDWPQAEAAEPAAAE